MTFGEKLLELRQKAQMSQDALAEKLEVSRQAVSKWERDEAMPETDNVIRIAQIFGVSTDYLLLAQQPTQPQPQRAPSSHSVAPTGARIERFIRRHGYKGGYFLMAGGAVLCIIALLIFLLLPKFGTSLFDIAHVNDNDGYGGVYIEGDLPDEVIDQLIGQDGNFGFSGGFGSYGDSMLDGYNQAVDQMQQGWVSSLRIMSAMIGVPLLLMGVALITLGAVIVVKGKKIADQTPKESDKMPS